MHECPRGRCERMFECLHGTPPLQLKFVNRHSPSIFLQKRSDQKIRAQRHRSQSAGARMNFALDDGMHELPVPFSPSSTGQFPEALLMCASARSRSSSVSSHLSPVVRHATSPDRAQSLRGSKPCGDRGSEITWPRQLAKERFAGFQSHATLRCVRWVTGFDD